MDKGTKIKVLDHGYVTLIDHMGTDEGIIEAARMSTGRGFEGWDDREECEVCGDIRLNPPNLHNDNNCTLRGKEEPGPHIWKKKAGDKNLMDFLWRKKHATPFEMCELQIEVAAPIFVFREWHRHRTQSYNEFSARYSVMPNEHYVPEMSRIQVQSKTNKQSSGETMPELMADAFIDELQREQQDIYSTYEDLLKRGVAKEVARINTPVSRYSKMRAKTDLRNWLMFCNLRSRPDAQYEIRQYANAVGEVIKAIWPRVWELFEEYDLYGVHFSRWEMNYLRGMLKSLNFDLDGLPGSDSEMLNSTKAKEFIEKLRFGGLKILS